jgi:hypothetical protein
LREIASISILVAEVRQALEVLKGGFGLIEEIKTPVVSGVGIR